jgi:hypothetical protein
MEWIDPPDCPQDAEQKIMLAIADDGVTVLNRFESSECMAGWICWMYGYHNFYPGNSNITWRIEEEPYHGPIPPIDSILEVDGGVQAGAE